MNSDKWADSFPVHIYLSFKGDERLGKNDVIVKIEGYATGVCWEGCKIKCSDLASLDATRSRQILLSSDWERVWGKTMNASIL